VSAYKREPRPPARIIATISFAITLFSPFALRPCRSGAKINNSEPASQARSLAAGLAALFFGSLLRLRLAGALGGGLLLGLGLFFSLFRLGFLGGRALLYLGLGGSPGGGLFLTGGGRLAGSGLFGGGLFLALF